MILCVCVCLSLSRSQYRVSRLRQRRVRPSCTSRSTLMEPSSSRVTQQNHRFTHYGFHLGKKLRSHLARNTSQD